MVSLSYKTFKFVLSPAADKANITSYTVCSDVAQSFATPTINIIRSIAIALYLLSEMLYSITILRLFVSNILKLTIFCKEPVKTKSMNGGEGNLNHTDSHYFLKVSIRTANLLIFAICTNYLILIKYAIQSTSDWMVLVDVFSNYISMYLSFGFASKYYDCIFSPCHDLCYACCVRLCYCCCLPKFNLDDNEMADVMEERGSEISVSELAKASNHSSVATKVRANSTTATTDIAINIHS